MPRLDATSLRDLLTRGHGDLSRDITEARVKRRHATVHGQELMRLVFTEQLSRFLQQLFIQ